MSESWDIVNGALASILVILGVVFLVTLIMSPFIEWGRAEVSAEKYDKVAAMATAHPELSGEVKEALATGKLTNAAFERIKESAEKLDARQARERLETGLQTTKAEKEK